MSAQGGEWAEACLLEEMEWSTPQFKRAEVDWAGRTLVSQMKGAALDWDFVCLFGN